MAQNGYYKQLACPNNTAVHTVERSVYSSLDATRAFKDLKRADVRHAELLRLAKNCRCPEEPREGGWVSVVRENQLPKPAPCQHLAAVGELLFPPGIEAPWEGVEG